ncbi:MAG: Bifunctional hemolysin/adenylate cyclase precursor [Syntrophorhabdus sp. PtaU1.Bin058]|nr:MAG: Bifunctional hemolysin/adenylate cyclase precursor [Syntrophorhabdus sp. PtaU1.Bin058]
MKQWQTKRIQYREEIMDGSDGMYHAFFQGYWYSSGIAGVTGKVIKGDMNDNEITGTKGNDTIRGLGGDDTIFGSDGDDVIDGGYNEDRLFGGAGKDTIYGGMGEDWLEGGSGDDILYGYTPCLIAGMGDEQRFGNDGAILHARDTIFGGDGNDKIYGYYDDDYLVGGTGNDTIYGGSGSDTLDGGTGKDELYGGSGNDMYYVDDGGDVVREEAGEGNDTILSSVTYTLGENIEDLALTGTAAINGIGNTLDNFLFGNSADNILKGYAGDDILYGNAGDDILYGGDGDDSLNGGDGDDRLSGSAGNDTLDGGTGRDRMYGGSGNDIYYVDDAGDTVIERPSRLFEEQGIDTVISSVDYTLPDYVENLTLLEMDPFFGPYNISYDFDGTGNSLDNVIIGNHGDNSLYGLDGNDTLYGGKGNDRLSGGAGSDIYGFSLGDGSDMIYDYGSDNAQDTISFDPSVSRDTIAFFRDGRELSIAYGDTDHILVSPRGYDPRTIDAGIEKVQLSDGFYLTDSDINKVIQDLTSYANDHGINLTSVDDVKGNQELMNIIVSAWHQ